MEKSTRFFRYVWRINGILILVAVAVTILAVGSFVVPEIGNKVGRIREAENKIALAGSEPETDLTLGHASLVEGTNVMRAELQQSSEAGRFSSGYSSEVRNILFIEPGQKAARWLLPDNEHVIAETSDIKDDKAPDKPVLATAAIVNSPSEPAELAGSKLLLFDPTGRKVVEVASKVRQLHVTSVSGEELTLLFERNQRFVLAAFDPRSLSKLREQEIEVPSLKK